VRDHVRWLPRFIQTQSISSNTFRKFFVSRVPGGSSASRICGSLDDRRARSPALLLARRNIRGGAPSLPPSQNLGQTSNRCGSNRRRECMAQSRVALGTTTPKQLIAGNNQIGAGEACVVRASVMAPRSLPPPATFPRDAFLPSANPRTTRGLPAPRKAPSLPRFSGQNLEILRRAVMESPLCTVISSRSSHFEYRLQGLEIGVLRVYGGIVRM